MKREREYIEVSEDEWSAHSESFKPSRILNNNNKPPPIAFSNPNKSNNNFTPVNVIECSSSSEEVKNNPIQEDLEDDDAHVLSTRFTRGNRFIIKDDDDENDNVEWSDDDEEDVVKNALKKCERISKELKQELYGTTSNAVVFHRYSEVDMGSSAVRIVTQEDVNEACGQGEEDDDDDFKPILKPYQLLGVNFLLLLYRKKIGGAILADEMGLGKTVQAITYLTLLKHLEGDDGPHLIVCPASVLENWERELRKWCPSFSVLQYHGSARATHARELSSLGKAGKPPPYDVILVCYSLFERHSAQQKDDRKILRLWRWSCVIMDEAHALKDKSSYRWKNLMSVTRNAKQRLMLTGTPLQNDLHVFLTQIGNK